MERATWVPPSSSQPDVAGLRTGTAKTFCHMRVGLVSHLPHRRLNDLQPPPGPSATWCVDGNARPRRPWQEFREFHFEILPWPDLCTISRNYPLRESTKTFVKVLRNFPLSKPQNRANRRRKGPLRREIRQLARSHGLTCPWPPQYYRLHTPYASSFVFMHDNFLFSPVFFRARFFLPQNAVRGPKSPP